MINVFDNFFLNAIPHINSKLIAILSNIADPQTHLIFWGLISLYFLYKQKWEVFHTKAFYLFKLTGLIMFFCGILKITVGRARPFLLDESISGFFFLSVKHAYLSFPSSHTAIATAFSYYLKKTYNFNRSIYLVPLFIGFTRLLLNEHFTTDVIGGVLIGFSISFYLEKYYDKALLFFLKTLKIQS
ncbi:MAG: hypothetical protein S4CHLAM20_09320 [Chlamydiia bacterium]|nr:hypothetical protein [Chlamydiia bacterium]